MTTFYEKDNIQCGIHKVWDTVSAIECYHTWRSDVEKTEVIDEKRFLTYTKDGYSTMFTITAAEPYRRWEFDVENSHIKGHWTVEFTPRDCETEIIFTGSATSKGLLMRPIGKSVFEKTYLRKMKEQFITDLKKSLG